MSNKLPSGLGQMYESLMPVSDRVDRALTLGYVRMLFDSEMPTIAGFDPRQLKRAVMPMVPSWEYICEDGNACGWLEAIVEHLNTLSGTDLLVSEWEAPLGLDGARRAMQAFGRWQAESHYCGGDILGHLLELLRPDAAKGANGAFYTPWPVCYVMAKVCEVVPGDRMCDPACGSGRMLLAAIQVCREDHPGEPLPDCQGIDIDAMAVKACRLNLSLAGYYAQHAIGLPAFETTAKDLLTAAEPVEDGPPVAGEIVVAETKRGQLMLDVGQAA